MNKKLFKITNLKKFPFYALRGHKIDPGSSIEVELASRQLMILKNYRQFISIEEVIEEQEQEENIEIVFDINDEAGSKTEEEIMEDIDNLIEEKNIEEVEEKQEQEQEEEELYVCSNCNKEYKSKHFYEKHIEDCK